MSDLPQELRRQAVRAFCAGEEKLAENALEWEAAELIEQQQKRIAELEAKTSCCMGVGNGNGRLFVYGDNESIKTAQRYVLERDELAVAVERLRDALQNYTAEKVCCGQGEIQYSSEGEPIGQECCGKPDIDWPDDVTALLESTPSQNLNAIKREAFIEGFNAGFTDCWIVDEEEHADTSIEIAAQRYPD